MSMGFRRHSTSPLQMNILLIFGLVVAWLASLHIGLHFYSPKVVWGALQDAKTAEDLVITRLRLPRSIIAITCGALLGLSGLHLQSVTRNPLAEPGLLGVNTGAAFAVVLALTLTGTTNLWEIALAAFLGAILTMLVVFTVSGSLHKGMSPVAVLLAGVTLAAMLSSLTQLVLITNESALEDLLFWLAGSFADRELALLQLALPVLLTGMLATLYFAGSLDAMKMDDESAAALGVAVLPTRLGFLALGASLAAAAVAIAGPIVFLGLVAPHLAKRITPNTGHASLAVTTVLLAAVLAHPCWCH